MGLVKVVDIETGEENQVNIDIKFPDTIYRNADTRALDERHADCLLSKFSPIPLGSCFTEGEFILPFLAGCANTTGFYFGVEHSAFSKERQRFLGACESERTIKRIQYRGKEIIVPTDFK